MTMKCIVRNLVCLIAVLSLANGACTCATPPPPTGEICGAGSVGGTGYVVDPAGTELAIVVLNYEDQAACSFFHSHAILATAARFTYNLQADGQGEVLIEVPASGLNPDPPELRAKLLPAGQGDPLSDSDRGTIVGSVLDEVQAVDHPVLKFTLSALTATDGTGSATLASEIAGGSSTVPVTYTATAEGTDVTIEGTAILAGEPHGMPRGSLGACVDPNLTIHFKVRLTPGEGVCAETDTTPVFEPRSFPDVRCAEENDYNTLYNEVIGPRCLGCHGDTLRIGATSRLVEWAEWRNNSIRYPDGPLYEEAFDYIHRAPEDGLSMPPPDGPTALSAAELASFDAWISGGALNGCDGAAPPKTFGLGPNGTAVVAQDEPNDDDPDCANATLTSARPYLENNCLYCHDGAVANAPVAVAEGEVAPQSNPFYIDATGAKLGFWEAGVARAHDLSMPPGATTPPADDDDAFNAYREWVRCGLAP
jgi:hypothetical protein